MSLPYLRRMREVLYGVSEIRFNFVVGGHSWGVNIARGWCWVIVGRWSRWVVERVGTTVNLL